MLCTTLETPKGRHFGKRLPRKKKKKKAVGKCISQVASKVFLSLKICDLK
jgi:hypothetical protein